MEDSTGNVTKSGDTEEQQIRAHLREKFLRFIANIASGQEAELYLQEFTTVTCKLRGFDINMENIAVEDLKTKHFTYNKAILRSSDILSITLPNINVK